MLSILFLSSSIYSLACSYWPHGEDIRFSLFSSNLTKISDTEPLFYSTRYLNEYSEEAFYGPSENIEEWYAYFGEKVPKDQIDELIYGFKTKSSIEAINDNQLMIHFNSGYHKEAAEYIFFARSVEEALYVDPWEKKEMDELALRQLMDLAESQRAETSDEYLKIRYTYQLIVMNYYLNDYVKMERYNTILQRMPRNSVLKAWADFFVAIANPNGNQRLYELSLVFDKSKSKSEYIYKVFPRDESKLAGALNLCQNDHEKSVLLSISAFKNPGRAIDQLEEIAKLDPKSELLELLLIREINKMEDWYFTDRYTTFGTGISTSCWECDAFQFIQDKNFQSDKKYLKKVVEFAAKMVENRLVENRGLWFSSLAYMQYMLEDKKETEKYINLANSHADNPEIKAQVAVISTLNLVKNNSNWDKGFQSKLMKAMIELESMKESIYNYDRFHTQFMLAVSRKYLEEDEVVLAALFESKVGNEIYEPYSSWGNHAYQAFDLLNENADSEDLDELFDLWNKSSKTQLEEYLFADMEPLKWRLTDLRGTQYLREDNLEKALEIYETIPDSVWVVSNWELHYYYNEELDDNPFESNLFGRDYSNDRENAYTKPEFVREIIRLKKELDGNGKNKARTALLLGNAYYNMTYHGNSYYYTEYAWSSWEEDDFKRDQSWYYSSSRALKYYKLAEELAPNDTYAAFCHCLQLKCKRDGYYKLEYWKDKAEQDWTNFMVKYPDHAHKLKNCDEFYMYENSWQG